MPPAALAVRVELDRDPAPARLRDVRRELARHDIGERQRAALERRGLGREILDGPRQPPRPIDIVDDGRGVDAIGPAEHILKRKRELRSLKSEILGMREKMHAAHPNTSGLFDVKHDRGGMIDIEFTVQATFTLTPDDPSRCRG
mgnify:CR=1 FL=1